MRTKRTRWQRRQSRRDQRATANRIWLRNWRGMTREIVSRMEDRQDMIFMEIVLRKKIINSEGK